MLKKRAEREDLNSQVYLNGAATKVKARLGLLNSEYSAQGRPCTAGEGRLVALKVSNAHLYLAFSS